MAFSTLSASYRPERRVGAGQILALVYILSGDIFLAVYETRRSSDPSSVFSKVYSKDRWG